MMDCSPFTFPDPCEAEDRRHSDQLSSSMRLDRAGRLAYSRSTVVTTPAFEASDWCHVSLLDQTSGLDSSDVHISDKGIPVNTNPNFRSFQWRDHADVHETLMPTQPHFNFPYGDPAQQSAYFQETCRSQATSIFTNEDTFASDISSPPELTPTSSSFSSSSPSLPTPTYGSFDAKQEPVSHVSPSQLDNTLPVPPMLPSQYYCVQEAEPPNAHDELFPKIEDDGMDANSAWQVDDRHDAGHVFLSNNTFGPGISPPPMRRPLRRRRGRRPAVKASEKTLIKSAALENGEWICPDSQSDRSSPDQKTGRGGARTECGELDEYGQKCRISFDRVEHLDRHRKSHPWKAWRVQNKESGVLTTEPPATGEIYRCWAHWWEGDVHVYCNKANFRRDNFRDHVSKHCRGALVAKARTAEVSVEAMEVLIFQHSKTPDTDLSQIQFRLLKDAQGVPVRDLHRYLFPYFRQHPAKLHELADKYKTKLGPLYRSLLARRII